MMGKKKSGRILRRIRIAAAVPVLALFLFLFCDFTVIVPAGVYRGAEFLQFIPSVLKFLGTLAAASTGWIIVLVLTLLFGRIYCSCICPLGISFDAAWRLAPKGWRACPPFRRGGFLRYGILVVLFGGIIAGSLVPVNLLDPFSNFGRISVNLFRPLVVGVNNGAVALLESLDVYKLPPYDLRGFSAGMVAYSLLFFIAVIFCALRKGRLYCNTICPVGALLGIVSQFAFFRIAIDEGRCTRCGACARRCKASCIDFDGGHVDAARCVVCMNCLEACPEDAIALRRFVAVPKKTEAVEGAHEN